MPYGEFAMLSALIKISAMPMLLDADVVAVIFLPLRDKR